MTVADVLERAADLLERDGWCQGAYEKRDGRRCALGAIMAASVRDSLRAVRFVPVMEVRGREWDTPTRPRVALGGAQTQDKIRWELAL